MKSERLNSLADEGLSTVTLHWGYDRNHDREAVLVIHGD